jgi:gliding motility-associated-like protein
MNGSAHATSAPKTQFWFSKSRVFLFFILLLSLNGFSQEICDNGIDDDGDNLVDVFDPDCPCDDETLLCLPSCEYAVPGGPLNFTTQWTSEEIVPNYQTPLVADIDNDDVPEVVIMSSNSLVTSDPRRSKDLLVISGATGATELTITTPFMAWVGPNPIAIADVDGDGFGEIFIASIDHTDNALADRRYLYCYEHTGALKWKSNVQYGYAGIARFGSSVGLADFNYDGIVEVYVYNQVFNAQTGILLVEGGAAKGKAIMTNQAWGDVANPIAANLTTNAGLELACGNTVYNVTITNTSGTTGNSMSPIVLPLFADGYTSLADIDLDGNLDLVVASEGSTATLYVWNPGNGSPYLIASTTLANTGGNWIGVPFIGDMDKDCQPEIGVTRSRRVYALDYDGTATLASKWTLITTDASGFTGITMFDFNQDGTQELVYRDESNLRIIDGSGNTPVTVGTNPCSSGTGAEMPVVADVDGDGQAEICVSCATSGVSLGKINVFSAADQAWAPCRSIWNQYNYFNVNINNNLSIPLQQQQHQVLLSTVTCPYFTCSENRPFNSFLTQATFLTQEGCPVYPASDVELSIQNNTCNGSAQYDLSLIIENVGAAPSDSGYPIRFYAGNPFSSAATPITVLTGPNTTAQSLNPGATETISYSLDIAALPKPFNLFVILNDDGSNIAPFNFPLSTIPECNFADNVVSVSNINCCPFGDLAIAGFTPPSATFCEGGSSEITVNVSSSAGLSSAVYTWTLPDNSTVTNDTVSANSSGVYSVTVKDNAQCLATSTITINEVPQPTQANAGTDQTICSDNTALQGNIPSIGVGTWTLLSGTGAIASAGSASSNVTGIDVGTSVFRWAILNGTECISDDTVSITRINPPSISQAGSDQTLCADIASINANIPVVGTGAWSLVSGSGTIADASLNATTISNLGVGTNVFQWTISNSVCTASTDQVSIIRTQDPSLAEAGSNQSICDSSTTLAANIPNVGGGVWTLISGSGVFSNVNSPTSQVSGLSIGANVFQWTISNGTCSASSDQVQITRDQSPSQAIVGNDQINCSSSASINATNPIIGIGTWSLLSGTGLIANPNAPSTTVSNLGLGVSIFQWTVSNGVCPANTATISITQDTPPSSAQAGTDQQICANTTQLQGENPSIGTGEWSLVSGTATISDPSSSSSSVNALIPGTTILQWTISNGVCPSSSDQVSIIIDEPVTPPNAGADFSICESSGTLAGNTALVGTGIWTVQSGTASITNPTSPVSEITDVAVGTLVLRWTITNGTCTSFDDVTITRTNLPSLANAGSDQQLCSNTTLLSANQPTVGIGTWSVLSGTATFTDSNNPNDQISELSVGTNELVWTITSGVCPVSQDTLVVIVNENPISPDAGVDQELCAEASSLNATPATLGVGTWSVISGSATISSPINPTSEISNLSSGENVFRWTIVNGACTAFDQVSIVRNLPPSTSVAGDDQEVCEGETVTLDANIPTSGTGIWTLNSGQAIISDSSSNSATLSGLTAGTLVLSWTITSGNCPTSSDQISILVNSNNISANAGNDQTICADSTQLTATIPTTGNGTWTLVSGTGFISDSSNASSTITDLQPGTNVFRWTVSSGTCLPVTDDVTILVDTPPSEALAGDDQVLCSDNTVLNANSPTIGTGVWSLVTGSGTFANASNATTAVTSIGIGVNVFQWSISNGVCPSVNDQVVIQRDSLPVQANAGSDISICNSDTASLNATEPTPGTGLWTLISGDGIFEDPTSPVSNISGLGSGINAFIWTVTTGNCPPTRDTVNVINLPPPSIANAGIDTSLCSTNGFLDAETPTNGSGVWSSSSAIVFGDISDPNSTVSNLSPGANTIVWTVSNGICPASIDTLNILVDKNPITPNAGPDLTICSDTITLSAASPTVGTGEWSLQSGTLTIADSASPSSFVSAISLGTSVLRWTITNGACVAFDEMQIIRSEPPSIANAGTDIQICDSTAQLAGNTPVIGNGLWTIMSGFAQITDSSNPTTTLTEIAPDTTVLRWTISSGTCGESFDEVTIIRDTQPFIPQAGDDQSVCSDSTQLTAIGPVNLSGTWSLISGSGNIVNADSVSTSVNGLGVGTNIFRWTLPASGTCPAAWDEVSIVRNNPTSLAFAGNDSTVCSSTYTITANSPSNGSGVWLVISGNSTLQDSLSASTLVSNLDIGANVFEWRISNGTCPVETDQVTITRLDTAYAGADQAICDTIAQLTAIGFGNWTLLSGSGTIENPDSSSTLVSNLGVGTNIFQWTLAGATCPDANDEVSIVVSTPPSGAFAGNDQSTCNDTLSLSAATPTIGNGVWSIIQGSAIINDSTSSTSLISNLSFGENILLWTVSNGICPTLSDTVIITRGDTANAGLDQTLCADSSQLAAVIPTSETGLWTVVSGTGIFADATNDSTTVSGLSQGINIFQWSLTSGSCPNANDEVSIIVSVPPSEAIAGIDESTCNDTLSLSATTPTIGNGVWSIIQGSAIINDSTSSTSLISNLSVSENILAWTVSSGACPSLSDTVVITRGDTAYAGFDQILCADSTVLAALNPSSGIGLWTVVSGTGIFGDATNDTTSLSGLSQGINIFQWTVTGAACPDSTDQVEIKRQCNTPPIITNDDYTMLEDSVLEDNFLTPFDTDPDSTTLTIDTTQVTGPTHGTVVVHPDGSFTYTPIENYNGLDTFIVEICDSGIPLPELCGQDTIIITIQPVNDPPIIVNDTVSVNPGSSVTDNLLDNDSDIEQTTLVANPTPVSGPSNGVIVVNEDGSFTYTPNSGFIGTDTVVVQVCDGGIPLPEECAPDTIFINVGEITFTVDAGPDQIICGTFTPLNATPAEAPATGLWTIASGSCLIIEQNVPNTNIVNIATDTVLLVWTVTLNGVSLSDTMQVVANPAATPAFAGEDQVVCGSTSELQGNAAISGDGTWSVFSGSGLLSNDTNEICGVTGLSVGTNTFVWTIEIGPCSSSDTVAIVSYSESNVQLAADTSICPETTSIILNAEVQGPVLGTWQVVSGSANFSNDSTLQTNVSGLSAGLNVIVYNISNGACGSSDSLSITVLNSDDALCTIEEVFIPEGFSPDEDGSNDVFVIYGLKGQRVTLKVFNRWGNLVYESDNYQNNWDGICSTGLILAGERLPESTYYYIVQIEGENETRKGYLTLWR